MIKLGKENYFTVNGKLHYGSVNECPKCKALAYSNAVQIVSGNDFASISKLAKINGEVTKELYYDEKEDDCFCETCCN